MIMFLDNGIGGVTRYITLKGCRFLCSLELLIFFFLITIFMHIRSVYADERDIIPTPQPSIKTVRPQAEWVDKGMSQNLSTFGLPFKYFGSPSYDKADKQFPCHLSTDKPPSLFNFLFKWTVRTGVIESMISTLVREICLAQYMPLGNNRFLVEYRGLGFVNMETGKYSRLYGGWTDEDAFSKTYNVNPNTSIVFFRTLYDKYFVESYGLHVLIFRYSNMGEVTVQFAQLALGTATNVNDKNNEPLCTDDEDESGTHLLTASTVFSPDVRVIPKQKKAIISLIYRIKNCKTGIVTDIPRWFVYHDGKLIDQNNKPVKLIDIENLY